ncbi:hypothetical protein [Thermospira aquatica]|uniref:CBM20 domain-containing protein n=1 Tax=Thermospira aquatica TaxID=2828656 RepID=A0AAX3BEB7_9SPIR|nr:hypothetical protein [Thermospira aquatica]URA10096.1 hypothetical protein KDW03_11540 [Thermospira aquatica]
MKKMIFLFFLLLVTCGKTPKPVPQGPKPGVFILGEIVLFVYQARSTNITNVALTGDFFGWKAEGFPLTYDSNVNLWRISIILSPGTYQYKYILNGTIFTNDPFNPLVSPDGKGGLNSVIEIRP